MRVLSYVNGRLRVAALKIISLTTTVNVDFPESKSAVSLWICF